MHGGCHALTDATKNIICPKVNLMIIGLICYKTNTNLERKRCSISALITLFHIKDKLACLLDSIARHEHQCNRSRLAQTVWEQETVGVSFY